MIHNKSVSGELFHISNKQRLKIKKFVLILVLIICSSCTNKYRELDDNLNLSKSMKNFYDLDVDSYSKGELFQAKILSIARVKSEFTDCYLYKYQIVIAPTKKKNMQIKKVEINFDENLDAVMESGAIQSVNAKFILDFPKWENVEDFEAYQFDFVIGSFSESYIENEFNIHKDQVNKYLSSIDIEMYYDFSKENIKIEYEDEILEIKELFDIPSGREDLKEIMNGEYFSESIKPFLE